jgi:hypothetical protein
MTPAASSGDIEVQLESLDSYPNVVFTATITGVAAADSEQVVARAIYDQLSTLLVQNDYNYDGPPVFSAATPPALWRVHRTEHVISAFSQSQFLLTITENNTGSSIESTPDPILCTVAQMEDMSVIGSITLEDETGTPLTDAQKITLLKIASSKLVAYLSNKIVVCTFLSEEIGNYQQMIRIRKGLPGIYIDTPACRRPWNGIFFSDYVGLSASSWNYIKAQGLLQYINSSNLINFREPTESNTEIRITYVAGNYQIPDVIKMSTARLASRILEATAGNLRKLSVGSMTAEFFNINEVQQEMFNDIGYYILTP